MPPVKKKAQKKRTARSLVTNRLENVSKDVFKAYYPLITELAAYQSVMTGFCV